MKVKISIAFLFLATVFTYLIFKGGYFSATKPENSFKNSYSSQEIIGQLVSFDLRDYEGNKIQLNEKEILEAQKTVIHLWASWCGPCVGEVPELIEFSKKNPDVVFIIVSLDDFQDDIEKFMKSFPEFNSNRFKKVWDRDKLISKYLNADRLPMSVILQKDLPEPQLLKAVVDWKRIKI